LFFSVRFFFSFYFYSYSSPFTHLHSLLLHSPFPLYLPSVYLSPHSATVSYSSTHSPSLGPHDGTMDNRNGDGHFTFVMKGVCSLVMKNKGPAFTVCVAHFALLISSDRRQHIGIMRVSCCNSESCW
jgi:hypothetical protein